MKTSLHTPQRNEIVGGNIFASDINPREELEAAKRARDAMVSDKPLVMTKGGKIYAKDDGIRNSLDNPVITELKGDNDFAAQWYEANRDLYDFEVREMKKDFPNANLGVLKDDRLYWDITLDKITDLSGKKHSWWLRFIYDSDHPHNKTYGGSIKVYPMQPSYEDLVSMASRAGRGGVPHIYQDAYGNKVICTAPESQVVVNTSSNLTALTSVSWTASWATHFLSGLSDAQVWAKFSRHRERR